MKVMEFAFDSREESDYLPHLYPVDSVCYTGTHDNVTLVQWFQEATAEDVAYAKAYLGLNQEEGYTWGMIRGAMGSVSRLCVVQMQDYLELGKEARMNFPGTLSSANWTWRAETGFDSPELGKEARMNFPGTLSSANWTWRAETGFDSPALAKKIAALTRLYGRYPAEK